MNINSSLQHYLIEELTIRKGFLFYCVSCTARHTQNVRKNEREDKKVEVVVADKKKVSLKVVSTAWCETQAPEK